MRKTAKVMVVVALLVVLTGGAVLAATINGTPKNDTLEGTPRSEADDTVDDDCETVRIVEH